MFNLLTKTSNIQKTSRIIVLPVWDSARVVAKKEGDLWSQDLGVTLFKRDAQVY